MIRHFKILVLLSTLGLLAGCGDPSKQDIIDKTKNVETKTALESTLGKPDDISKFGPLEKWTYNASNGSVIFIITGDRVAMQATGDRRNKTQY